MNKQEKYNPDVNKKYDIISKERDTTRYTFTQQVYKGITNQFPKQISSPDDLKIKAEEPDYDQIKINMELSLREREKEKAEQERLLKELAEKNTSKKLVINTEKTSTIQENHADMKQAHKKFSIEKNDNLLKEKLVLNNVLDFINKL
jgi:hypothetical protein